MPKRNKPSRSNCKRSTAPGLRLWESCGTQLNVIYCIGSASEMSKFPMSPFALRVLVPFLRAIVVGAWFLGLACVTTE